MKPQPRRVHYSEAFYTLCGRRCRPIPGTGKLNRVAVTSDLRRVTCRACRQIARRAALKPKKAAA